MHIFVFDQIHFVDFYNKTYFCVSPTDVIVLCDNQRRTTPSKAYKKHENENKFHFFDPKNSCFAVYLPSTYYLLLLDYYESTIALKIDDFHRLYWSGLTWY
jgi:hypothetical protein